jgi:hypothetical protein
VKPFEDDFASGGHYTDFFVRSNQRATIMAALLVDTHHPALVHVRRITNEGRAMSGVWLVEHCTTFFRVVPRDGKGRRVVCHKQSLWGGCCPSPIICRVIRCQQFICGNWTLQISNRRACVSNLGSLKWWIAKPSPQDSNRYQ